MSEKDITHNPSFVEESRATIDQPAQERTKELAPADLALRAGTTTRQRSAEEFELLLRLYRIVIEAQDLPSAYNAALQIVCQFTGWDLGMAWIPDPGETELQLFSVWQNDSRRFAEFVDICRGRSFARGVGIPGRVWTSRKPEWTSNLAAEAPELFPLAPLAAQAGIKAALAVPVVHGETFLAALFFYLLDFREKDSRLIEIVSEVAAQLGSALRHKQAEQELRENEARLRQARAQLETKFQERTIELTRVHHGLENEIDSRRSVQKEVETRVRQQEVIGQIGQLALRGAGLAELMQESSGLVAQTLGVEFCKILELLPDRQALRLCAGVGWEEGSVGAATVDAGAKSQAGFTLLHGKPVIVADLRAESRFGGPPLLREHGIVSGMSVIIPGKHQPFGVLGAHTAKQRTFTADDVKFLQAVANVISTAIARSQAEEEIQRGAAWLKNLIATTQDAVISIDRAGRIVLFNPSAERIFGYGKEEIAGQKVTQLMPEPYATEHDGYVAHYEKTGEARAIGRIRAVKARRKNGETFPIELSLTEIDVDQDVHYAAFIRDISDKARLQEQLVESERLAAIGSTAAKIGHELANPINGMSLTIQLLEQRLSRRAGLADGQIAVTVKRLKDEISRLNQLAAQFRSISRKETYDFQPTDLAGLINDLVELQKPHLAASGIQLRVITAEDLPAVEIDANKIKQVLLNLLKNAAEAMPDGGKITVQSRATDHSVLVEITDSGIGIPEEVDAFEPFATTKKDGTGIGLVIARQILTAHGGNVSYRSRVGEGTTFKIEIPRK